MWVYHWVYWMTRKDDNMKVLAIPIEGAKDTDDPYVELDVEKDVILIKENEKGVAIFYTSFGEFYGLAFSNE
ncbi:hypothetical protein PAV_20c00050 [Paenibacillus alvei DSM 29]|nr:hypothetical protein PAV_20c00050 [Paenibacillus alvei DSM 29]